MPNAVFIGFTGTPLLKKDKQTSLEVFGGYIHTYKFGEGVEDEVVLDLVYEARDIDQRLGSQDKIDAWFEAKTKGLNDWQKAELKKQVGHDAEGAQLPLTHGPGGERHRLRLQRQAAPVQRTRQRHARGVQHLRGVQVFHAVPEDPVQGQVRGRDILQSAGPGRDAGGNRRQHRDRQAVHLQHLYRAAEGRRRQAGHDQDRDLRGARPRRCSSRSRRT